MPSPSSSLATLRPDLGGSVMEIDLMGQLNGFIGLQILPVFEAPKASGTFGRLKLEQLLHTREVDRSPTGSYNRGEWEFEPESYVTTEKGLEERVDDNEAEMYKDYFDAELISAERCLHGVLHAAERRVRDAIFSESNFSTTGTSSVVDWATLDSAKPLTDVELAVQAVYDASGFRPNTVVMTWKRFRQCVRTDEVKDLIKNQNFQDVRPEAITQRALATLFQVDQVLVADSTQNNAVQGDTPSLAPTWGTEYVWVGKVARTRDIREPCVGRTIHWDEDGSMVGGAFETYRDENVRSDIVRCRHQVDEKLIHTAVGHLIKFAT